jgi:hypothetical protein
VTRCFCEKTTRWLAKAPKMEPKLYFGKFGVKDTLMNFHSFAAKKLTTVKKLPKCEQLAQSGHTDPNHFV